MNPNSYISSMDEVIAFLSDLKQILLSEKSQLDMLLKKKEEQSDDPFTTENTLISLNFDSSDVKDSLLALTEKEYIETIVDDKSSTRPPFWVFGKVIQSKDIYIKLKIKNKQRKKVFCVSFHYAKYPFKDMPYI